LTLDHARILREFGYPALKYQARCLIEEKQPMVEGLGRLRKPLCRIPGRVTKAMEGAIKVATSFQVGWKKHPEPTSNATFSLNIRFAIKRTARGRICLARKVLP
jgi:hypothetical protein